MPKSNTRTKTKTRTRTKTRTKRKTKKLISSNKSKSTKSNKIIKSEKYKLYLQNRIKINISQFKKGSYKSKNQAIAISYNQTNKQFNQ